MAGNKVGIFWKLEIGLACHLYKEPGASITPLVHRVVNQADVTMEWDALVSRLQVGLGCYSVLVVAEIIAGIRQNLYQRDTNIRYMPLLPIRHDEGQPIQDKLPEAGIVLRKIVDLRLNQNWWWTGIFRFTIKVAGAVRLEGEIYTVVALVEAMLIRLNQAERVRVEISSLVNGTLQTIRQVGIIRIA